MKQRDLIKLPERNGWKFFGTAEATIFIKESSIEKIPRHREIKEALAKAIIRNRGLK